MSMNASIEARMNDNGEVLLCTLDDLIPGSGVCALCEGRQVALFLLPEQEPMLYALGNYDPLGGAGVLSRGIVGDLGGESVVASPLYKNHYSLRDGHCLEDVSVFVPTFEVRLADGCVYCRLPG
jgi:nitrite reductase (NADH) small subunit